MTKRTTSQLDASTPPHRRSAERWLPLLIVVAAVSAYANSFNGAFVLDDVRTIAENTRIQSLWPPGALLSSRRPVVDLSLAINYAIGGVSQGGYHAVNLLIHLLAALTLYGIVRRTLLIEGLRDRFGPASAQMALVVALIWVVHPLQTESVTYLIQRAESLMGLFYLLTLYCVIRGAGVTSAVRWYAIAVACCALSMGSKAVGVTAPIVILLYDRIFLTNSWRSVLRLRGWFYVGLAATWSMLIVTKVGPQVLFPEPNLTRTVGFAFKDVTPYEYALTQPGVIWHYLWLALWPTSLCLDYQWPVVRSLTDALPQILGMVLLVLLTLWGYLRKPRLGFLGIWFFFILAPTSSVIPIKDSLFEHRMYLPLAAVVVLAVLIARAALNHLSARLKLTSSKRRLIAAALPVVVVLSLGAATLARNRAYQSQEAMWRDVVAKRPENSRAWLNLGKALLDRNELDAAANAFRSVLRVDSAYLIEAHYNLGKTLTRQNRVDEAALQFNEALRLAPFLTKARSDLGNLLARTGRIEEAIEQYREAIRLDPDYVRTYVNLATILLDRNEVDEAIGLLRRAVALEPEEPRVRFSLGQVLYGVRDFAGAQRELTKTLELQPNHTGARRLLDALRRQ